MVVATLGLALFDGRSRANADDRNYGKWKKVRTTARKLNAPPNLVLFTNPQADTSTNPPTIRGVAPLTVTFGLCRSDDPDMIHLPDGTTIGDSLNWQYNFGDSGRAPWNTDGTFNPDWDHTCRTDHTYGPGEYTAWVSVTDKHLEDQGRGVGSLARQSRSLKISVASECSRNGGFSSNFDSPILGPPDFVLTFAEDLSTADASFDGSGQYILLPSEFFFVTASGQVLIDILGQSPAPLTITFSGDQQHFDFWFATSGPTPLVVEGFDKNGASVFTTSYMGTIPPDGDYPEGVAHGTVPPFRKLVISANGEGVALDDLSTQGTCQ